MEGSEAYKRLNGMTEAQLNRYARTKDQTFKYQSESFWKENIPLVWTNDEKQAYDSIESCFEMSVREHKEGGTKITLPVGEGVTTTLRDIKY